jgi:Na+/phosphate symporter
MIAATALSTAALAQTNAEIVCSYAPSQSKAVAAISGAAGGAAATATAVAAATGLTAVAHSSGAAILTGSSGYIAGTIGGAAAAPVIVTVGLVVGGVAVSLELVCASRNHPEQVERVRAAASEFGSRFKAAMRKTTVAVAGASKTVKPAAGRAAVEVTRMASDAWQYVYRESE